MKLTIELLPSDVTAIKDEAFKHGDEYVGYTQRLQRIRHILYRDLEAVFHSELTRIAEEISNV